MFIWSEVGNMIIKVDKVKNLWKICLICHQYECLSIETVAKDEVR